MSSRAITAHSGPPEPVPIFPIPELSFFSAAAINAAGLDKFHELNWEVFAQLVSVMYVGFMEQTAELRKRKPAGERLYKIFFASMKMILTAASPQRESLQMQKPEKSAVARVNGLAREFLWNHMMKEKVAAWQDYYAEGKRKNIKADKLVDDFTHYIIGKAFEEGAATSCVLDESKLREARRVIQAINLGERRLRAL